MEFFKGTQQESITSKNGLYMIDIPLKGRLLSLDNIKSFSNKKKNVLISKFVVENITTSSFNSNPSKKLEYIKFSNNLYLDSLIKTKGEYINDSSKNSKKKNSKTKIQLFGNKLDHKNEFELYKDFHTTFNYDCKPINMN